MPDQYRRPDLIAALFYQDPSAALDWLEKAFGFERVMVITDTEGNLAHSEMRLGDSYLMIGHPWAEFIAAPGEVGGRNTQVMHVHLEQDVDGHCARARAAGATILMEPANQFYGDRTYRASDPEGHIWTFGQTVRTVSREEAEAASGLKIEGWI